MYANNSTRILERKRHITVLFGVFLIGMMLFTARSSPTPTATPTAVPPTGTTVPPNTCARGASGTAAYPAAIGDTDTRTNRRASTANSYIRTA